MSTLVCAKRDAKAKVKALRREGIVPAVIYGKNLDSSISIQIEASNLSVALKSASLGSQIALDVDGEEYFTMLKRIDYIPMSSKVEHLDFQVLTKGEKIKTSVRINFINKDVASRNGILQEQMNAIEYEVLPKDIIDHIDLDLETLEIGTDIKVQDLDIAKDDKYNVLTPLNATIVLLSAEREIELEETEEDAVSDVPVIGAEEEE